MLTRSVMNGVSKILDGVGKADADWALDIFMLEAVKSGWSRQKFAAAEFKGTELGSKRACDAMMPCVDVTPK